MLPIYPRFTASPECHQSISTLSPPLHFHELMNSVNSSSDGFSATKADLVARAPYPKLNTSAPPPTMAAMPNGKPGPSRTLFTQPQRQAGRGPSAPSTISTASSTSSGATIRPPVTTPRALSPTSGHSQLPFARDGFRRMSSIPGGKKGQLKQHPHWDDPAKVAQDIALLDEKSVLEGLSWRLDQYLDIQEPFGLIVPEMVEAARMDPNDVCGMPLSYLINYYIQLTSNQDLRSTCSCLPFLRTVIHLCAKYRGYKPMHLGISTLTTQCLLPAKTAPML